MRAAVHACQLAVLLVASGCCSELGELRIFISAPGDVEDSVTWREDLRFPPGLDFVAEYDDDATLAGEAIEVYREWDGQPVPVSSTTTRGIEHGDECAHTHTVYELRDLDNGLHLAVHRRLSGTGAPIPEGTAPAWTTYDGDEALVFPFCIDDNSGMTTPCNDPRR